MGRVIMPVKALLVVLFLALTMATVARGDVDAARLRLDSTLGGYHQTLGVAGVHAVDVDRDGRPELFVGNDHHWSLLGFDPPRGDYSQLLHRQIERVPGTVVEPEFADSAFGDVDEDGEIELLLLRSDGRLLIHDATTGEQERDLQLSLLAPLWVETAQLVPGGREEILVFGVFELQVLTIDGGPPLWALPLDTFPSSVALGQLDADAALEIVLGRTDGLDVVDSESQVIEWSWEGEESYLAVLGDVDQDGFEEILACNAFGTLALDYGVSEPKWTASGVIIRPAVIDEPCAGGPDLLVVTRDSLTRLDGATGEMEWVRGLPVGRSNGSPADLAVGDFDGDGEQEVAWAAGVGGSGDDLVSVADAATGQDEWLSPFDSGGMTGVAVADLDGDGRTEVLRVTATSASNAQAQLVHSYDLHQNLNEHVPAGPLTFFRNHVQRGVAVAQLDADPALEYLLIVDAALRQSALAAYDGRTHEQEWQGPLMDAVASSVLAAADLNGDGVVEVVVGTNALPSGGTRAEVLRFDGRDGTLSWTSGPLTWSAPVTSIRLADVDDDPALEMIAVASGGGSGVHVYDGSTNLEEWSMPIDGAYSLEVLDLDGDPGLEILVGLESGRLTGWDVGRREQVLDQDLGLGRIQRIRAADLDGDGVTELILSRESVSDSVIQILDSRDFSLTWQSHRLIADAGFGGTLVVADADDDGSLEILCGTRQAVPVWEHSSAQPDADGPRFDGLSSIEELPSTPRRPHLQLTWAAARDERSPPIEYFVHRSTTADFSPGPETLVGRSRVLGWRDPDLEFGTTYHYRVRAADRLGNRDDNGVEMSFTTAGSPPSLARPVITAVDETDCIPGLVVSFEHDGQPSGVFYELLVDGVVAATPVVSPVSHLIGDSLTHSLGIRAVLPDCSGRSLSREVSVRDSVDCTPGAVSLRVAEDPLSLQGVRVSWSAVDFADSYNAYVGSLAALAGFAYDHVPTGGSFEFPDSPSPSTGCDVADGPAVEARVTGLPAESVYLLVVADHSISGEGSYGVGFLGERGDPAVDPRPRVLFCP